MTPADARQRRADRDRRVLDALRLGGSAEVIAAALGISPELVRRIAFEARKNDRPDAVPLRKPYRCAKPPQTKAMRGWGDVPPRRGSLAEELTCFASRGGCPS